MRHDWNKTWREASPLEIPPLLFLRYVAWLSPEVRYGIYAHERSWRIDLYQITYTLALLLALALTPHTSGAARWIVLGLVFYRLLDVVAGVVWYLMIYFRTHHRIRNAERSLVMVFGWLFEVVTSFAILYVFLARIETVTGQPLEVPMSAFYYSLVTITTLGTGEFRPNPSDLVGQGLVIGELMIGVLMLLVAVPLVMAAVMDPRRETDK